MLTSLRDFYLPLSGFSTDLVASHVDVLRASAWEATDLVASPQTAQTLIVIYIRDSIALRFEPFKRMYENGSKIALNSTCSKGFK